MFEFLDDIPIPTPPPLPTYIPPEGMQIDTDWMEGFGQDWADEVVLAWQTIPLDFRTGIQIAILFAIFLTAFSHFVRILRKDNNGGSEE